MAAYLLHKERLPPSAHLMPKLIFHSPTDLRAAKPQRQGVGLCLGQGLGLDLGLGLGLGLGQGLGQEGPGPGSLDLGCAWAKAWTRAWPGGLG